jgi:hypothetical protein
MHGTRCEPATAGTVLLHPADKEHRDRFGAPGAVCVNVSPSDAWLDATCSDGVFASYRAVRGQAALHLGNAIRRGLGASDTAGRLALEAAALSLLSETAAGGGATPGAYRRKRRIEAPRA